MIMRPTTPPQWFESSQTFVEASSSLFHQRACSKIPTAGTGMLGHYSYKVNIAFFFGMKRLGTYHQHHKTPAGCLREGDTPCYRIVGSPFENRGAQCVISFLLKRTRQLFLSVSCFFFCFDFLSVIVLYQICSPSAFISKWTER